MDSRLSPPFVIASRCSLPARRSMLSHVAAGRLADLFRPIGRQTVSLRKVDAWIASSQAPRNDNNGRDACPHASGRTSIHLNAGGQGAVPRHLCHCEPVRFTGVAIHATASNTEAALTIISESAAVRPNGRQTVSLRLIDAWIASSQAPRNGDGVTMRRGDGLLKKTDRYAPPVLRLYDG